VFFISLFIIITFTCSGQGSFTFTLNSDSLIYGTPGATMIIYGYFENTSNEDVILDVIRTHNSLPPGWQSTICTDICYAPEVDSTLLEIDAFESATFEFSFYSTSEDTGYAGILIQNQADLSNNYFHEMMCITDSSLVGLKQNINDSQNILIYPNPSTGHIIISNLPNISTINIYEMSGHMIRSRDIRNQSQIQITLPDQDGIYLIQIRNAEGLSKSFKVIKE